MKRIFVILAVIASLVSCTRDDNFSFSLSDNTGTSDSWSVNTPSAPDNTSRYGQRRRNVMLLYSAGFNNLCQSLDQNIDELSQGFVPQKDNMAGHILLVYSKLTSRNPQNGYCIKYSTAPTESALFRIYKESDQIIRDTIKVWGTDVDASSPETMREVLQLVYDTYPAKGYGMVFSSHASGWLPSGYYNDPSKYDSGYVDGTSVWSSSLRKRAPQSNYPEIAPFPEVKSIGMDSKEGSQLEMELDAFADAIPFRLDYLLLDACLSGCVEVAWQLRDKADIIGFSQTEVLAEGFDYKTIGARLLQNEPDPLAVCQDYFNRYDAQQGQMRSATISVVDTRKMDNLASVCKSLFEKYREKIYNLNGYNVQGYFRFSRHFFYDLKDILIKAGITAQEREDLDAALSQCVLYKAATESFLGVRINSACGFSMYLPSMGSAYLDSFYKTRIAWNGATELVK